VIGSVLDSGDRGAAETVLAAGCLIMSLMAVAIILPIAVVAVLLHAATSSVSAPPAALLHVVTSAIGAVPTAASGPQQGTSLPLRGSPEAIEFARRYLGIRYVFGGTDPAVGLDCSGLVQLVFRQIGVKLPRTAQQQFDATVRVPREQLQPGDLVFFARTYADPHDWITHVGIYIGNGQQINAPTEGQVVSIQPVFTGFWGDHFVSGGRASGL
jgi:cell wall-associated NlpC family hydrolase